MGKGRAHIVDKVRGTWCASIHSRTFPWTVEGERRVSRTLRESVRIWSSRVSPVECDPFHTALSLPPFSYCIATPSRNLSPIRVVLRPLCEETKNARGVVSPWFELGRDRDVAGSSGGWLRER